MSLFTPLWVETLRILLELAGMAAGLMLWSAAFVWIALKLENSERRVIDQKPKHLEIDRDQHAKKHTEKKTNDNCLHR